jgi:hypothetical protein
MIIIVSCSSVRDITKPFIRGVPNENDAVKSPFRTVCNDTLLPAFHFVRESPAGNTCGNIFIEDKPLDASFVRLDEFVKLHKTLSFVIIRNDTVLYEYYAPFFAPEHNVTGFSIAKSFVAMLIGIAIDEVKSKM